MSGSQPRYSDDGTACLDCGAAIADQAVHTRFHSILSGHAWALAVLQTAHLNASVHDRYEAYDRIHSKRFDSWSADALAALNLAVDDERAGAGS